MTCLQVEPQKAENYSIQKYRNERRMEPKNTKTVFQTMVLIAAFWAVLGASPNASLAEETCGKASWYAMTSKTASGERASPDTMTAAHRSLPFGTLVNVTNLRNGRSVSVRVNDRGPFVKDRIIDVTRAAAFKLGFKNAGWTPVKIAVPGMTLTNAGKGC